MRTQRLTLAAWQLLQRLGQPNTVLQFCEDDGRFYFVLRGDYLDLVRPSTIDALTSSGMIRREREAVPSYVISDKGVSALRKKLPANELEEEPVSPYPTPIACRDEAIAFR